MMNSKESFTTPITNIRNDKEIGETPNKVFRFCILVCRSASGRNFKNLSKPILTFKLVQTTAIQWSQQYIHGFKCHRRWYFANLGSHGIFSGLRQQQNSLVKNIPQLHDRHGQIDQIYCWHTLYISVGQLLI